MTTFQADIDCELGKFLLGKLGRRANAAFHRIAVDICGTHRTPLDPGKPALSSVAHRRLHHRDGGAAGRGLGLVVEGTPGWPANSTARQRESRGAGSPLEKPTPRPCPKYGPGFGFALQTANQRLTPQRRQLSLYPRLPRRRWLESHVAVVMSAVDCAVSSAVEMVQESVPPCPRMPPAGHTVGRMMSTEPTWHRTCQHHCIMVAWLSGCLWVRGREYGCGDMTTFRTLAEFTPNRKACLLATEGPLGRWAVSALRIALPYRLSP